MTDVAAVKRLCVERLTKALLPVSALLATAAGLVLSVLAPHFLPSSAYVEFTLLFGYGQLTAAVLFEWSRQAGLRYAFGRDSELANQRRRTLVVFYVVAATALAAGAGLILCLPTAPAALKLGAIIALYAAAQGVFDARQAFARASGDDGRFTVSLLSRAILSLALFAAVALTTRSGIMATLALAASYLAATLVTSLRKPVTNPFSGVTPDQLRFLIAFGLTGAAASIVAIMVPNIVRSAAVASAADASVGGFLLALDLSQKGLSAIGMVASLVLTQKLYRAFELHSEAQFRAQGRIHIAASLGVLAPAFVGFVVVQDQMAAVLAPEALRADYLAWAVPLTVGAILTCIRIFTIDPFFYAHGRSKLVLAGAVANIVGLGGWTGLATLTDTLDLRGIVVAYGASAALGLAVSTTLLVKTIAPLWPVRDLTTIVLGCLAMAGATLIPLEPTLYGLAIKVALCGSVYLAVIGLLDFCGIRRSALSAFDKAKRHAA